MNKRECEGNTKTIMSEIKVDEVGPEISLNRQSSGLHNLTGTKSRFQPVKIKALLDFFGSDDDDTEPRDSDDNSDAESLQALPDDEEAENCNKNESVSPKVEATNFENGTSRVSIEGEAAVDQSQEYRDARFTETKRGEDIVPRSINSVLPSSVRKNPSVELFNFDGKPTLFTPRASHVHHGRPILTERREENLFDRPEAKPDMETPLKFRPNSSKNFLKVLETPMKISHGDFSQNAVETPGVIFSHWSRNNYLQTPTTYNQILPSTKKEEAGGHCPDPRLGPQMLLKSESRPEHRKPLGEATHFNQPSGVWDRPPLEHHNLVRRMLQLSTGAESGSTAKENSASDTKCEVKENLAGTTRRSLIVREKPSCAEPVLPATDVEKKSSERVIPKNNNSEIESRNGRSTGEGSGKPSMLDNANSKSNKSDNVQFSVAAKPREKKYGQLINVKGSDYVVLGKLGQGMSGNVLRVQEVKTGELRAIKCVDLSQIDKETAQGCLEEVSLLERLRAPCIINMYTFEIKSHWLYVVLEMGDTDLSKLLKSMPRDKQLPLTMILYYWTEMLTAVKHIHDNDVIHSDLKPANFLLVRGRLKLIDFGIASTLNSEMTSVVKNTSLGTLHYISPEAIEDVGGNGDSPNGNNKYKINFQSDVWSLGCILYGLVYGQTPFEHIRADWAKIAAITNPKQKIFFPPAQAIGRRGHSSPPPFLVDVMRRCLQHDKKARPTVAQLLEIPYVGCNCPPASSLPSISPAILSKIKESLAESEWRQLLDALERRRPI